MDFEEAFATCIRTGSTARIVALGVTKALADEPLICETVVPSVPGTLPLPTVLRPRPVIYAILCHQSAIVEQLFGIGADVTTAQYNGWHPIHYAVATGDAAITRFLLSCAPAERDAPTADLATPLHLAAAGGTIEIAVDLLRQGAAVNGTNAAGNTPLHLAMIHTEPRLAEILLAFGADVRIKNAKGQKPDQVAAQRGNRALTEFI